MYSGLQPAMTAFTATFSAVMATDRCAMKATCFAGSRRAASSIALTRSGVGGITGRPSVQPCWKQNSIASLTSCAWYRLDVSTVAISASLESPPPSWPPQYTAPADECQERRGRDRDRRHRVRLGERAEEPDGDPPHREDLGQRRDTDDHPERARQERETAGSPLLGRRERRHDRRHVGDFEEAEPESRREQGDPEHAERGRAVGQSDERQPHALDHEPGHGGRPRTDTVGQTARERRGERGAERRQHEEGSADGRAESTRVDEVERDQEPD